MSLAASAASASVIPISGYFGMIKRIIEALGLDDGAKGKFIPSESKPLVKDINGDLASGAFSYSSVMALKRIGRYLKQTPNRGMVMNPSSDVC